MFKNVLNNQHPDLARDQYDFDVDIKTYPMIWRKYLSNMVRDDYTQIIDIINKYHKNVFSSNSSTIDKVKKLNLTSHYYINVVMPFIKNYFELPREYNASNYPLTTIMNMICHITSRIIFTNLFGLIIKCIIKFVIKTYPNTERNTIYGDDNTYQNYIAILIRGVIDDHGDNDKSRLIKYVFGVMPMKVIKTILQIYEGENEGEADGDKTNTLESLFLHINKIIGSATIINVHENSSLMSNLKDYVYPFYISYVELFVKEMKNILDNYLKSLQYQCASIHILQLLADKAMSERI